MLATPFKVQSEWNGLRHPSTSYTPAIKSWIARHGGLTPEMKKVKNGVELWKIVDPCPEDF